MKLNFINGQKFVISAEGSWGQKAVGGRRQLGAEGRKKK